ncbi:hypothetical protein NN561_011886 [Cricetulus griseus]
MKRPGLAEPSVCSACQEQVAIREVRSSLASAAHHRPQLMRLRTVSGRAGRASRSREGSFLHARRLSRLRGERGIRPLKARGYGKKIIKDLRGDLRGRYLISRSSRKNGDDGV